METLKVADSQVCGSKALRSRLRPCIKELQQGNKDEEGRYTHRSGFVYMSFPRGIEKKTGDANIAK